MCILHFLAYQFLHRFSNFFSNRSCKKVFLPPVPPLSNSSLSTLSKTGMSYHQIPSWKTLCVILLPAFPASPFCLYLSLSGAKLLVLILHFPIPIPAFLFLFLSRFLTQDNQEQNGTAPTEWPVDSQEILCCQDIYFPINGFGVPVWASKRFFCLFLTVVVSCCSEQQASGTVTDGKCRENKGRSV